MADDTNRDGISNDYSLLNMVVESPTPPPPPGFTSPFNTIEEWLIFVCNNNHPEKPISEYQFNLYLSTGNKLLSLTGYNHTVEQGVPTSRVDFEPRQHIFFALPNDKYNHSILEQLQEQIVKELNQFLSTNIFKSSFLSKGYSITTNFAGEIWSK